MIEKSKFEISLLLPDLPDEKDACVNRLRELISAKKVIDKAHIREASGDRQGQLCVHFDPQRISTSEVRALVHRAGAELDQALRPCDDEDEGDACSSGADG